MGDERKTGLGRHEGHTDSHDIKNFEYLSFISVKYDVDLSRFFDSMVEAWNQEKSVCDTLLIECRGKFRDQAVFLITSSGKIVTQFHISEHLLEKGDLRREFEPNVRLHSSSWKKYKDGLDKL